MKVGNPLGLITGYPGWLSSRLLECLRQPATTAWQVQLAPYRWRVLAAPGVDPGPLPDNVETVHTGDIREPATATGAMKGVDLVLHSAGILHPRRIPDLCPPEREPKLNNKLKDSGQEWLEKGRYPVCLSDAREELLKPQLLAGCVNVLVWCATGLGWEVEANPCPLQLPGIINAIRQAPVKPRFAIVCLAHGPMRAAEALHKSGVSVVIWVRADLSKVSLSRLFEQVIVPALDCLTFTFHPTFWCME